MQSEKKKKKKKKNNKTKNKQKNKTKNKTKTKTKQKYNNNNNNKQTWDFKHPFPKLGKINRMGKSWPPTTKQLLTPNYCDKKSSAMNSND